MESHWQTTVHDKIYERRSRLGPDVAEVAEHAGVTWNTLMDMEGGEEEIYLGARLGEQKRVYQFLGLDILELFDLNCCFCREEGSAYEDLCGLSRNEIVRKRREALGLSQREFDEAAEFKEGAVERMEADPDYLDSFPIDELRYLADGLKIPLQLLLGTKCARCGR